MDFYALFYINVTPNKLGNIRKSNSSTVFAVLQFLFSRFRRAKGSISITIEISKLVNLEYFFLQCCYSIFTIDNMIWYDTIRYEICYMIWYVTIRYIMIWFDMIYHMIRYVTIRYDMIWHDMTWHDMMWYDTLWYDMILYMVRGLIIK